MRRRQFLRRVGVGAATLAGATLLPAATRAAGGGSKWKVGRGPLAWLRRIARHVDRHPDAFLVHYHEAPPASPALIAKAEKAAGAPLPAALRELYAAADGLQLAWIHRTWSRPRAEWSKKPSAKPTRGARSDLLHRRYDGCIDIQPLQAALIDRNIERHLGIDPNDYPDERGQIRPFDLYSEYYDAALLVARRGGGIRVVPGTDHRADYSGAAIDAADYLQLVARTCAHVDARSVNMGYKSLGAGWWESEPKLDLAMVVPRTVTSTRDVAGVVKRLGRTLPRIHDAWNQPKGALDLWSYALGDLPLEHGPIEVDGRPRRLCEVTKDQGHIRLTFWTLTSDGSTVEKDSGEVPSLPLERFPFPAADPRFESWRIWQRAYRETFAGAGR